MRTPGTYVVVLDLEADTVLKVGHLGEFTFGAGKYCYVGSARGPGGLEGRLARHLRQRKGSHWHIDYLLQRASVLEVWSKQSDARLECVWAAYLLGKCNGDLIIPGFGSSDCRCRTHLIYLGSAPPLNTLHQRLRSLGAHRWRRAEVLSLAPTPDH